VINNSTLRACNLSKYRYTCKNDQFTLTRHLAFIFWKLIKLRS